MNCQKTNVRLTHLKCAEYCAYSETDMEMNLVLKIRLNVEKRQAYSICHKIIFAEQENYTYILFCAEISHFEQHRKLLSLLIQL